MLRPYQNIIDGQLGNASAHAERLPDPIGIGAVGGSGTRLLLQMMVEAGVSMASPMNPAGDAFEWPDWPKLLGEEMLARHTRAEILPHILQAFEGLLIARRESLGLAGRAGWKVPGTFHWLQELGTFFPGFQYIHLMRHGLDMAYSRNQNQIKNWADSLGVEIRMDGSGNVLAWSMLEYWLAANEAAQERAARHMPGRMLVVRFEDLCRDPHTVVSELIGFLNLSLSPQVIDRLAALVVEPESVGRYRDQPWQSDFSDGQLRRLEALGYGT